MRMDECLAAWERAHRVFVQQTRVLVDPPTLETPTAGANPNAHPQARLLQNLPPNQTGRASELLGAFARWGSRAFHPGPFLMRRVDFRNQLFDSINVRARSRRPRVWGGCRLRRPFRARGAWVAILQRQPRHMEEFIVTSLSVCRTAPILQPWRTSSPSQGRM